MSKGKAKSEAHVMTDKQREWEASVDATMAAHNLTTRWCVDDLSIRFDAPHRFKGATKVYMGIGHDERVYAYIEGPTNLDLWKAAERVFAKAKNPHMRFIEGFKMTGVNALQVQMGN